MGGGVCLCVWHKGIVTPIRSMDSGPEGRMQVITGCRHRGMGGGAVDEGEGWGGWGMGDGGCV